MYISSGKFIRECQYVNGITVAGLYTQNISKLDKDLKNILLFDSFLALVDAVDAVYIISHPQKHYAQTKEALQRGKHVICESPIVMSKEECDELFELAREKNWVLFERLKTVYSTAYARLVLLVKTGTIGKIVSIDATCTSIRDVDMMKMR